MKRYISLDVLRGITVAFMCIVNNPGSWSHVFAPLRHSPWDGCTPTDLVAPFFIFCVGCAMAFSFVRFDGQSRAGVRKVIRRGVALFALGLLLNMFPFFPVHPHDPDATFWQNWLYWLGHVRVFGILQHIAIAYMIGGLLVLHLRTAVRIAAAIVLLSIFYNAVLLAFGTAPGPYTLEGNAAGRIDVALIGPGHVYHGYRLADGSRADFDPEGLLSCVSGACTVLLGYLVGNMIRLSSVRHSGNPEDAVSSPAYTAARIFVYGSLSLAFGEILSIFIPINKPLWSTSYVFYSAGWAMIALAFLAFVLDVKGYERPFRLFRIMGTNALAAFVLSVLFVKIPSMAGFSPSKYFGGNEYMSLLWAILFTSAIFLCQWLLYRRKIIIRL